jgi:hypothetical protein
MESFPTHTRPHRGHDANPSAVRRGTFKNKTWVAPDRSGSNSPFQSGHLGADAPKWERGGARGLGHGRGRGKGRSPRPDFGSSQRTGDVSEVEDDTEAAAVDGTEPSPGDEPVLETLEERERYYQEVSSGPYSSALDSRRTPVLVHIALARQGPRGGEKKGYSGGQDGRPASPEAP